MKLKKLMAGFLSLSFMAGLLPISTISVEAATAPDSSYIIYEDFDDITVDGSGNANRTTGFELDADDEPWVHSYVTEEDGNVYMQMQNTTGEKVSKSLFTIETPRKLHNTNGGFYEYSFRLMPDQTTNNISGMMSLIMYHPINGAPQTFLQSQYRNGGRELIVGGQRLDVTKVKVGTWVSVKATMSIDETSGVNGGVIITYTDTSGEEKTISGEYSVAPHAPFFSAKDYEAVFKVATGTSNSLADTIPVGMDDVYLKSLPERIVTFIDRGENLGEATPNYHGKVADADFPEVPARDGYDFTGWYTDTDCTQKFSNENVTESITIYAGWAKRHTITYIENGGLEVPDGSTITDTVTIPEITRVGYMFRGWYTTETFDEGTEFDGTNITGDITVYAKWVEAFPVHLNTDGGNVTISGVEISTIYKLGKIESLPTPVKTGHQFMGWYLDESLETPVDYDYELNEGEMHVYAKWLEQYVVTLELNGGNIPDDADYVDYIDTTPVIYVNQGDDLTTLPTLTGKVGFTFEAWCTDALLKNEFDGTVDGDITIYARYSNILFFEDFEGESNDTINWLQTAAGMEYNTYKDHYGVVEDTLFSGEGNKSYRVAKDDVIIRTPNGGPGLYELSFKVRQDGPSNEYLNLNACQIGSFLQGSTVKAAGSTHANSPQLGGNNYPAHNVFTTGSAGWIECTYRFDTVSGTGSHTIKYTSNGATTTAKKAGIVLQTADYIDGIALFTNNSQFEGTNFFFDDICLKKIESPTAEFLIEGAPVVDGIATDVALTPEIKINFSTLMQKDLINANSIVIKDSEGNALNASDYAISIQTVDEKSVATVNVTKQLENAKIYTITVTTEAGTGDYYLAEDIVYTFKTVPGELEIIPVLKTNVKVNGVWTKQDFTTLVGLKNLFVEIKIRNFAAGDDKNLFVVAALVDSVTGKQYGCVFAETTVDEGETVVAIPQESMQGVPNPVDQNAELHIFVWDGKTSASPLTQIYKITD